MTNWYSINSVKFKIIKYLYNREFAFIFPKGSPKGNMIKVRNRRVHTIQTLDFVMSYFKFKRENLYYSVASYRNGLPYNNYKSEKADQIIQNNWKMDHYHNIISYDFVVDIDCKNHVDLDFALESAKLVKRYLNVKGYKTEVRFSGRGFHVIVNYDHFSEYPFENILNQISIFQAYKQIAKELYDNCSSMIDTKIYDTRRLIKIPYSLVFYEDCEYVCLPLTDDMLENWKLEDMKVENILKSKIITSQHGNYY